MILISLLPLVIATSNVALRKPAQQVSTYANITPASKAVDGRDTGIYGDCSHTDQISNNWWKVDLMGYYTVTQVNIFPRDDVNIYRLQNFEVRVSVKNPTTFPSSEGTLCAFYSSIVPTSGTSLVCSQPITGRFVSVFKALHDHLEICELEVLGDRAPGIYGRHPADLRVVSPVRRTVAVRSAPHCALQCESDTDCVAFNLMESRVASPGPLTCELLGLASFTDPSESPQAGSTFFQRLT